MLQNNFDKEILNLMYEGIYFVDNQRKITFWNKGAENITGFKSIEVVGKYCYDNILNHVNKEGVILCIHGCPLQSTITDGKTQEANVFLKHKEGHRIPVSVKAVPIYEGNNIVGAIEFFTDTSLKGNIYKDLENYKTLAHIDQLTKLPNRRYLETLIMSKINEYNSVNINFGIAFMDIDHFKNINDTYGHDFGDEVLKMVSKTFNSATRENDIIGRWGGEEFIAILPNVNENSLKKYSERIRILVENSSIPLNDKSVRVTISLGATIFTKDDSMDTVVKRADNLMFKSKTEGRNRVSIG